MCKNGLFIFMCFASLTFISKCTSEESKSENEIGKEEGKKYHYPPPKMRFFDDLGCE